MLASNWTHPHVFLPSGAAFTNLSDVSVPGVYFTRNTTEVGAWGAIEATELQREHPHGVMETQSCGVAHRFVQNKPSKFPIISNM